MPNIITPENDKQPRIFIPSFSETATPKNQPTDELIEKWHDMTLNTVVYKQKDVDPNSMNGKLFFKPNHAYFRYENEKGQNEMTYLFNVSVFTGKDGNGNWVPHFVDITSDNKSGRPNFITVPCKSFLDMFTPVN